MANQNGKPGKPDSTDLRIVPHGKQLRATITIPLVVGEDTDLIEHINSLPPEQRQKALKNAVRGGIGYLAPNPDRPIDRSHEILERLDWLVNNLSWLIEEFQKLPGWFEQKFKGLTLNAVHKESVFDAPSENQMTPEDEEQLKKNLKKRKW